MSLLRSNAFLSLRRSIRKPSLTRDASQWTRQGGGGGGAGRFTKTTLPVLAGVSIVAALSFYVTTFDSWSAHAEEGGKKRLPPTEVKPVAAGDPQGKLISMDQVSQHDSINKGIWVVIQGEVYDVTEFVESHPGGKNIIIKNAGKDVTELYTPVHPANAISDNLVPSQHLGQVDPKTVKVKQAGAESQKDRKRREARENLPPVGSMLNLDDFEVSKEKRASRIGRSLGF